MRNKKDKDIFNKKKNQKQENKETEKNFKRKGWEYNRQWTFRRWRGLHTLKICFSETSSNYHSEGLQQKQLPDIFVLVWNKQKWTYPNGHGHTQWTYLMWEWSKSYNLVRFGEKSVFFLQKCGMWRFCFSLQCPNISQTTLGFQNFSSQFGKVWLLKLLVTFYPKIFWALIFWKTIFIQNYLGLNYS